MPLQREPLLVPCSMRILQIDFEQSGLLSWNHPTQQRLAAAFWALLAGAKVMAFRPSPVPCMAPGSLDAANPAIGLAAPTWREHGLGRKSGLGYGGFRSVFEAGRIQPQAYLCFDAFSHRSAFELQRKGLTSEGMGHLQLKLTFSLQ